MSEHSRRADLDVSDLSDYPSQRVLFEVTHRQVIGEVVEGEMAVITEKNGEPFRNQMTPYEAALYLIARNGLEGVYEFPGAPVSDRKSVRVSVEFVDA